MALVPILFRDLLDDYWEDDLQLAKLLNKRSSRSNLLPEDVLTLDLLPRRCRRKRSYSESDPCNEEDHEGVVAKKSANEFQFNVNVKDFKPEEISVKATDKFVTVEGKHEKQDDQNGYLFKHFVRRYRVPEGYNNEKISSTLSSDGVLTVKAPSLAIPEAGKERIIPVEKVANSKELLDKPQSNSDQSSKQTSKNDQKSQQKSKTEQNITLEDLDE